VSGGGAHPQRLPLHQGTERWWSTPVGGGAAATSVGKKRREKIEII
jgi:hypothetical protein